jgi:hypothetical protein
MTLAVYKPEPTMKNKGAALSKEHYDLYDADELETINTSWPEPGGFICLVTNDHYPGWVMLAQTPAVGLLESQLSRTSPSSSHHDRRAALCGPSRGACR